MKLKLRSFDITVATSVALLVLIIATYLPNLKLLTTVIGTSVPLSEKVAIFFGLAGSLGGVASIPGIVIIVISALLIGINTALLLRMIKSRRKISKATAGVGIGALLGALGSACAACGFLLILGTTVGTLAGGILVALPFHGLEFGIAGILILAATSAHLMTSLRKPQVCRIK